MRIQEQCGVLDFFSHPVPTYTADERYNNYPSNAIHVHIHLYIADKLVICFQNIAEYTIEI